MTAALMMEDSLCVHGFCVHIVKYCVPSLYVQSFAK